MHVHVITGSVCTVKSITPHTVSGAWISIYININHVRGFMRGMTNNTKNSSVCFIAPMFQIERHRPTHDPVCVGAVVRPRAEKLKPSLLCCAAPRHGNTHKCRGWPSGSPVGSVGCRESRCPAAGWRHLVALGSHIAAASAEPILERRTFRGAGV